MSDTKELEAKELADLEMRAIRSIVDTLPRCQCSCGCAKTATTISIGICSDVSYFCACCASQYQGTKHALPYAIAVEALHSLRHHHIRRAAKVSP